MTTLESEAAETTAAPVPLLRMTKAVGRVLQRRRAERLYRETHS
jgi:hypothetical protein